MSPSWRSIPKVVVPTQVHMEKSPTQILRHILIRCMAWGFSTSGVERTFSLGNWCKNTKREVPVVLANDEIMACQYPNSQEDQFLICFGKFDSGLWLSSITNGVFKFQTIITIICELPRLIRMAQLEWDPRLSFSKYIFFIAIVVVVKSYSFNFLANSLWWCYWFICM